MALKQRIVTEIYDDQTKSIVHREITEEKVIKSPKSIEDLGYNHEEQIEILHRIQDNYLTFQSNIYELPSTCSACGSEMKNYGNYASTFNSVFSDHKITLPRRRCSNHDCRKLMTFTVQGLFGDYRHPDLLELQAATAAKMSFVEAQNQLDAKVKKHRPVNGQLNLKRTVERIGESLHKIHQDENCLEHFKIKPTNILVAQTDGGYIKDKLPSRGNFEALLTKIYNPDNLVRKSSKKTNNIDREITHKSYAGSSYKDHHKSIKAMTLVAAKKEGLTKDTEIVALSDGAKNCWSVLKSLKKHCKSITYILDWYHIANKFDKLIKQLGSKYSERLESVKWKIWHGKADEAVGRLSELYSDLITTEFADKAHTLLKYIANNKDYLVHYELRRSKGEVYTSSAIESGIESVINARFKKKHKAQWNRESAHKVLQLRTALLSNQWDQDWQLVKEEIYKKVA